MNVHARDAQSALDQRQTNAGHTLGMRCVFVDEVSQHSRGMAVISDRFVEGWNFSHTCGVLDGKHVNGKCPPSSGSIYYNFSRVAQSEFRKNPEISCSRPGV